MLYLSVQAYKAVEGLLRDCADLNSKSSSIYAVENIFYLETNSLAGHFWYFCLE